MWAYNSVFYQIYPLGFCGAPRSNDGVYENRIGRVTSWILHLEKLGIDAVYFSPVFESDRHGYDTRDFQKIDCRLGNEEDFKEVCEKLHEAGIRIVLDGVFHHVGRGFFGFQDVLEKREASRYKDWFFIDFNGNSNNNDGLWYEGWEGHYDLVKLNLQNPEVVEYLLDSVGKWIDVFDIDGLRLDVAYSLDHGFLDRLRAFCDSKKQDFFLVGELLHGDYNVFVNDQKLHSCTNYECYKGLYSSFNSMNMFEIAHSLHRQFSDEHWALYTGKHLMAFVDNHDVSRVASILENKEHLLPLYGLLFGMPGIPCIYYGSEWGAEGRKEDGDDNLRPDFEAPCWTELTDQIALLADIHKNSKALADGCFKNLVITNHQLIFERAVEGERVIVGINAADYAYEADINPGADRVLEMITNTEKPAAGSLWLEPYSVSYWLLKE